MEKLIEELRGHIAVMNSRYGYHCCLDDMSFLYSNAVYPFNTIEYIMSYLIGTGTITISQYLDMRRRYVERNKYLYVFEVTAPRTFGEEWAERHLNEIIPALQCPSKELDPAYTKGQYDFWYDGIRIEVKASRAVRRMSGGTLISKALSSDSREGFDMNFQQMKPACCDVFVWIAVWRDIIRYWVLSTGEVENNPYYSSGQHRGNVGEGQLWIRETTIDKFKEYEVGAPYILSKIVEKGHRISPVQFMPR